MKTLMSLFVAVFFILSGTAMAGSADDENKKESLSAAAAESIEADLPIMLVFNADHCAYCELLHKEVLNPMRESGELEKRAIVREFNLSQGGKITDFDGERVRFRHFVRRYSIFATPTVVLLDSRGEQLAAPIVGYNDATEYEEILAAAMRESHAMLDAPDSRSNTLAAARH